ncbi:hypothetical protein [Paenibacillus arenosi]|uniref:Uncharacterized protein n=1 Tax=Paenibacillus arenosi TaxID=2774142 RepID=A0ABR9AT03_9BACL|nr:hypothetical protein [Paenibacillus arenosi]MBD8497244.1 hypothetical protein [Paenibacillus arenosi]
MKNIKRKVWIEAEQWAEGEWDIEDVNTDVIVVFSNRMKWIASFFTYKNIQTIRENNRKTGECLNGSYYWSSDMVLIDIGSSERIHEVINYLIESEEFENVFTRYPDVEIEDEEYYPKGFFVKN